MGEIKVSPDYNWFRSTVPLKKIIVDDDDSKIWSLYDAGPRSIRCPLIFLPPVSGTADVFFQQILALTGWGYRVIAIHLLQFHGTKYAAIDPSVVSAEELEVQKGRLGLSQEEP
ncbi:maspardin isoform 7 [Mus musculus]|uniref:maspardin isoform 7 n=1 Tax=Mus musculus TaxID=10090 RepID=UPI002223A9A7|nr:maspardin isoform 7 [Mus musculus]